MSTIVKTHLFEQDLHGTNPDNLITDEIQTLQVPGINDYYFIIPRAAPYFVSSLKVFNAQTNEPYIENEDYIIGHHFIEAMDSIGRPIAGSIRFMKRTIKDQVRLEYRTLGGNWGFDDTAILAELGRRHYNPISRVWGNIQALPYSFPPYIHDQDLDTLVGSEQLDESLNRIADAIDAMAAGSSDQHVSDFDNPHNVTKTQVGLELVENFPMATIIEAVEGAKEEAYINPKTLYETIRQTVGMALEEHVNNEGNVHNLKKSDIDLGNVANYPPATATTAVDISNDASYLTPYTGYLLMEALSHDSRLDQLLLDFNNHITTENPHDITPEIIGTYSKVEINQMFDGVSGGSSTMFGGKTPAEWEELFPQHNSFVGTLEGIVETKEQTIANTLNLIELKSLDLSSGTEALFSRIEATHSAYGVSNSEGREYIISKWGIVDNTMYTSEDSNAITDWDSNDNNLYFIRSNKMNRINSSGIWHSNLNTNNSYGSVWAFPNALFYTVVNSTTDFESLQQINKSGTLTTLVNQNASRFINNVSIWPSTTSNEVFGYYESIDNDDNVYFTFFGNTSWTTEVNNKIYPVVPLADIEDIIIGNKHVLVLTKTNDIKVFSVVVSGTVQLTNVTDTVRAVVNGELKTITNFIDSSDNVNISGILDTFVITNGVDFGFIDSNNISNPTSPWPDMTYGDHVYSNVVAGGDFQITLDNKYNIDFWGNSPDNSLIYHKTKRLTY